MRAMISGTVNKERNASYPLLQWLRERTTVLHFAYILCLVNIDINIIIIQ